MKITINTLATNGKTLMLAYDHGLEHGPSDFTDRNADPSYILEIARKAKLNGIVLHKGIAEKYYNKKIDVPLVLKLNGRTRLEKGEPISTTLCTVREAIKLGASAVGYTVYVGSKYEPQMLLEFANIERETKQYNIPLIAWMYPRGKAIKKLDREILGYSARIGLEIGAEMLKLQYTTSRDLRYAVKMAGKAKVLVAGGEKQSSLSIIKEAKEIMNAGASGMICGRNIWQHKNPLAIAKSLKKIIINSCSVKDAIKKLK